MDWGWTIGCLQMEHCGACVSLSEEEEEEERFVSEVSVMSVVSDVSEWVSDTDTLIALSANLG
jgi:hypothetical protein